MCGTLGGRLLFRAAHSQRYVRRADINFFPPGIFCFTCAMEFAEKEGQLAV